MSTRGPITGTLHTLPVRTRSEPSEVPETRTPPPAPDGLEDPGKAAWVAVMSGAPLLLPDLDAVTVERFCRVVDERTTVAVELNRGVLLEEPIVSPSGQVVGTRVVPNPAAAMLRSLDKQLDALCDRLGLVPAARARLGLTLTSAEKQRAEVNALMGNKFKEGRE